MLLDDDVEDGVEEELLAEGGLIGGLVGTLGRSATLIFGGLSVKKKKKILQCGKIPMGWRRRENKRADLW